MSVLLLSLALTTGSERAVHVLQDYSQAFETAERAQKKLLISVGSNLNLGGLDADKLSDFVLCAVDETATVHLNGQEVKLLDHPSFAELEHGAGLAIIDFRNEEYKQKVVSVLPERHVTPENAQALLDLPPGSLTQRTLIWALRVHPERPQSVYGTPAPELLEHCERHSGVQAASNNQHHNLPMNIATSEIVAESWPWNHNVVDAAIDVVHSWRQSPGHWGAASSPHQFYGYDMKTNGQKWFATGVFR